MNLQVEIQSAIRINHLTQKFSFDKKTGVQWPGKKWMIQQIRRFHQLRLVAYPMIFQGLSIYIQTVVGLGISEPSTLWQVFYCSSLETKTNQDQAPKLNDFVLKKSDGKRVEEDPDSFLLGRSVNFSGRQLVDFGGMAASLFPIFLFKKETIGNLFEF